jgi:hypothetical protein
MAGLLKGLGLMGAGAYGYQQAQESELLSTVNNAAGIFGGSTNRGSSASSSGGSEVGGRSAAVVKEVACMRWHADPKLGPPSLSLSQEMRVLQNEVCRLSSLLGDVVRGGSRSGQPLVIQAGGRSGWGYVVYPVTGVGLVYVYCRCVCLCAMGEGERRMLHVMQLA